MNRQDLKIISEKAKEKHNNFKHKICVCCGAGCISSGSEEVLKKLQEEIKTRGLEKEVEVIPPGAMGPCNKGPLMNYLPEITFYKKMNCKKLRRM